MSLTFLNAYGQDTYHCLANQTLQRDSSGLKTNAELHFNLIKNGNESEIKNLVGHVFVKHSYNQTDEFNTENAYIGFFKIDSQKSNPKYRPIVYKNSIQFKNIDAINTTGLENGMWGYLVADVSSTQNINLRYIFQAGDHMGGTTLFECKKN